MDFKKLIKDAGQKKTAEALERFLRSYSTPSFSSLPKAEVDLLALQLLVDLEAIPPEPTQYELVSKLKITSSKSRSLIYGRDLRRTSEHDLDSKVMETLKKPIIQKAGEYFVLDVENPLVLDHLKAQVRQLGYISDGSFSQNVVRLPLDAITALIEHYIPEDKRDPVKDALVAAGAPDKSLRGALKAVLRKVGAKVADETGDALMKQASEYMEPIVSAGLGTLTTKAKELFD